MSFLFGGGSSETSVEMPEWLQEIMEPLLGGTGEKFQQWQDNLWDQMMGGGGDTSGGPPDTTDGGNVRGGDQGRVTPDTPWDQMDPRHGWDDWDTQGWTPSDEGILGDNSRNIVGPSPWEQMAAHLSTTLTEGQPAYGKASNLWDQLSGLNKYERETNRLAGIYADPRNKPQESKMAKDWLNRARLASAKGVDFEGYESDPLFQQQMEAWEANVDPTITNAANAMGLGRFGVKAAAKGLSKTTAVRDAMKEYLTQGNINKDRNIGTLMGGASQLGDLGRDVDARRARNLQTRTGLGSDLRTGRTTAAQGFQGLGDRAQQSKLDAISNLMNAGGTMRGIRQEQADAPWEDFMRRGAAFEGSLSGPMGMIPGMYGSSSTSQKKNK